MNVDAWQIDALTELMNIGVGRAAGMLNEMVDSPIELHVPSVKILAAGELMGELEQSSEESLSSVRLGFGGPIEGTAMLLFPTDSAAKLVGALTGEEPGTPDLDALRAGTLSEVGNIVINGVMGSIGNLLDLPLTYELPIYLEASLELLFERAQGQESGATDPAVLVAHTSFTLRDLEVQGTILLIFKVLSFDALLMAIDAMARTE